MATIRLATERDAEGIAAIYGAFVTVTPISFEVDPPPADEIRRRISERRGRWPWLVCEDRGQVLGYAYAGRFRERAAYQWAVDLSLYVRGDRHRSGIGRALYVSLFEILRLQGYYVAYADITLPNPASVGLHESLGLRPLGVYRKVGFKLGAWHDVGCWELQLQAQPPNPAPPAPLDAVEASPGWAAAVAAGLPYLRL